MSAATNIANALSRSQRTLLRNIAAPVASSTYFSSREDECVLLDAGLITQARVEDVPDPTELGLAVLAVLTAASPTDQVTEQEKT